MDFDIIGLTYEEQLIQPEWTEKKNTILERDNHRCRLCGNCMNLLEVHHIKYIYGSMAWEYPNAMLITLCYECHKKVHGRKDDSDRSLKTQHISEVMDVVTEKLRR